MNTLTYVRTHFFRQSDTSQSCFVLNFYLILLMKWQWALYSMWLSCRFEYTQTALFIFIISAWLGTVMIGYSCNHTSRESNGPMSGVKIQMFRPNPGPTSVNNDLDCTFVCTVHKYLPTCVCTVRVCLYCLYLGTGVATLYFQECTMWQSLSHFISLCRPVGIAKVIVSIAIELVVLQK